MKWQQTLLALALTFAVTNPALAAEPVAPVGDVLELPEWTVTSTPHGGTLLLSDSPETVMSDGIMYQDTVKGDVRLFFHHVNGTDTAKKIVVLLENAGPNPANVTVYQHGLSGPSYNYLDVGKSVQQQFFGPKDIYLVEVPAKGAAMLDTVLGDATVETNMLVNGMYDFKVDQPVTVKVMMLPLDADAKKFAAAAPILSADQYRLRGTFAGKDRMLIPQKVYKAKEHGNVALTLADNELDKYVTGIDATDGSEVLNYGNYGVVYQLFLPSYGPEQIDYSLNPRGGEYAGFIGVKYQHNLLDPVATPADRLSFGGSKTTDFAPIGTFTGGQSLWLTFSPPGASNLPVKLIIQPK